MVYGVNISRQPGRAYPYGKALDEPACTALQRLNYNAERDTMKTLLF
jgi:hypothetical protein